MSKSKKKEAAFSAPVHIPWYRKFTSDQATVISRDLGLDTAHLTAAQAQKWLDQLVNNRFQEAGVAIEQPQSKSPEPSPPDTDNAPETPQVPYVLGTPQLGKKRLEWRAGMLPENFDHDNADESVLVRAFQSSDVWRGEKPPPKAQAAARHLTGQKRGKVESLIAPIPWEDLEKTS